MSTLQVFQINQGSIAQRFLACFLSWRDSRVSQYPGERANRELSAESAKVYQEMWIAFAEYCERHALALETLTQNDIIAFFELRARGEGNARMLPKGSTLSPRYAWRMLTLIDRITRHVAERDRQQPNMAARDLLERPEYRYANAREKDPLPEYYLEPQVQQIIAYLTGLSKSKEDASVLHWKEVRDRTAVALMLGAGLTPGDVRAATIGGVHITGGNTLGVPWKLSLPGNGNSPAHETPITEWAGIMLAHWLEVRFASWIPGEILFPSTLSGKGLSHAACYKVCKAVLIGAGMDGDSGGVFKLRHTFALRQLADGRSESEVARWLGLVDLNGMMRYRKLVKQPVCLV